MRTQYEELTAEARRLTGELQRNENQINALLEPLIELQVGPGMYNLKVETVYTTNTTANICFEWGSARDPYYDEMIIPLEVWNAPHVIEAYKLHRAHAAVEQAEKKKITEAAALDAEIAQLKARLAALTQQQETRDEQ